MRKFIFLIVFFSFSLNADLLEKSSYIERILNDANGIKYENGISPLPKAIMRYVLNSSETVRFIQNLTITQKIEIKKSKWVKYIGKVLVGVRNKQIPTSFSFLVNRENHLVSYHSIFDYKSKRDLKKQLPLSLDFYYKKDKTHFVSGDKNASHKVITFLNFNCSSCVKKYIERIDTFKRNSKDFAVYEYTAMSYSFLGNILSRIYIASKYYDIYPDEVLKAMPILIKMFDKSESDVDKIIHQLNLILTKKTKISNSMIREKKIIDILILDCDSSLKLNINNTIIAIDGEIE